MSTKILIGLAEFQSLILAKPEIEVQLLDKAVPQLAGLIARKVEERAGKVGDVVQQAVNRQLNEIGNKYGRVNEATRAIITTLVKENLDQFGRSIARQTLDEHLRSEMKTMFDEMKSEAFRAIKNSEEVSKRNIDAYAKTAAEREVMALLRAGNLVVKA